MSLKPPFDVGQPHPCRSRDKLHLLSSIVCGYLDNMEEIEGIPQQPMVIIITYNYEEIIYFLLKYIASFGIECSFRRSRASSSRPNVIEYPQLP